LNASFYVVAHEPGAEHPALPTWASREANPAALADTSPAEVERSDLPVPRGAYQLLNVLCPGECQRLTQLSEQLGYLPDAAVSLPREIRHNDNVVWVTDEDTDRIIWQRIADLAAQDLAIFGDRQPLGLNARFRFYRYGPGDYFKPHTDGAWPGSRVIDGNLVTNAYPDRYSMMTVLLMLNDDYEGGATRFLVNSSEPDSPANAGDNFRAVDIRTPAGGALCFPHGMHPLHCVHSSEPIISGTKYIIRTDMLFEL
jgi:predicted 2-oxoglutarate/Fe(II)-dependent dioxygenase YbiX